MPSSRQSIISEALAFTTNQLLEFSYSVLSAMILPIIQMCECKEVSMSVLAESPAMNEAEVHEAIVRRARALWEQRGRMDGHATEDWAQAEAEIREQLAASRDASPAFLSVQSQAFVYTCRYDRNCAAYRPGDFAPGDPIRFRVTGGKLYLKLSDSHELETTIVRKIEQRS
jgi:hypothetical protein